MVASVKEMFLSSANIIFIEYLNPMDQEKHQIMKVRLGEFRTTLEEIVEPYVTKAKTELKSPQMKIVNDCFGSGFEMKRALTNFNQHIKDLFYSDAVTLNGR